MHLQKIHEEGEQKDFYTYCLYDDTECLKETLIYADYLCRFRKRALGTIKNKIYSIKIWYEYLDELSKSYCDLITMEEQVEFIDYLSKKENHQRPSENFINGKHNYEKGIMNSTINRHISTIQEFYELLSTKGYVTFRKDDIPFSSKTGAGRNMFLRSEINSIPKNLTESEIKRLIDACTAMRDKLILLCMVTMGLRLGELCSLTRQCLNYENYTIVLEPKNLDLKTGRLKTGPRVLYGTETLFKSLERYFMLERDRVATCDNIFVNLSSKGGASIGAPMQPEAVQALYKRLKKRTGIKGVHAHAMRHTFATTFLSHSYENKDYTLEKLQKLLGHKNINTTTIYTHLENGKTQELLNNAFDGLIDMDSL